MSSNNYKIIAWSDGHGMFPQITDPFDIMLIGGDNINLYCQSTTALTTDWYSNDFVERINKLPFKDDKSIVLWIAGNHEVGFQNLSKTKRKDLVKQIKAATNGRAIYLENELYETHGLKIFGTPYCKVFGHWAFMKNDVDLKETYSKIPEGVDILLTHDAPYGTSDICYDWQREGRPLIHIGNEPLRDIILEKKPKLNLHGHLHSANHNCEMLGNTQVYCVSIVNEAYKMAYTPLCIDY